MDTKQRPSLTTAQKTAAALAVSCPDHKVQPGVRCPVSQWMLDGACLERRTVALEPR